MTRVLGNVVEMFIYSAVYLIIILLSIKIISAILITDVEKKMLEENSTALAIVYACIFIGIGLVVAAALR